MSNRVNKFRFAAGCAICDFFLFLIKFIILSFKARVNDCAHWLQFIIRCFTVISTLHISHSGARVFFSMRLWVIRVYSIRSPVNLFWSCNLLAGNIWIFNCLEFILHCFGTFFSYIFWHYFLKIFLGIFSWVINWTFSAFFASLSVLVTCKFTTW